MWNQTWEQRPMCGEEGDNEMTYEELESVKVGTRIVASLHVKDGDKKWRGTVTDIKVVEVDDLDEDETYTEKQYTVKWDEPHRVREDNGSITVIPDRQILEDDLLDFYEVLK